MLTLCFYLCKTELDFETMSDFLSLVPAFACIYNLSTSKINYKYICVHSFA